MGQQSRNVSSPVWVFCISTYLYLGIIIATLNSNCFYEVTLHVGCCTYSGHINTMRWLGRLFHISSIIVKIHIILISNNSNSIQYGTQYFGIEIRCGIGRKQSMRVPVPSTIPVNIQINSKYFDSLYPDCRPLCGKMSHFYFSTKIF